VQEIEAKILDIDRVAVEARLAELGARLLFDGRMDAAFFDFPSRRLGNRGALLRLRREGDKTFLTFKRRVSDEEAKVREETEVGVEDFDQCLRVLEGLGLIELYKVEKYRTAYELGSAKVVIDRHVGKLAHIPEFVEIEAESVGDVRSVAGRLGFPAEELRPWGLPQLIRHYESRTGVLSHRESETMNDERIESRTGVLSHRESETMNDERIGRNKTDRKG